MHVGTLLSMTANHLNVILLISNRRDVMYSGKPLILPTRRGMQILVDPLLPPPPIMCPPRLLDRLPG